MKREIVNCFTWYASQIAQTVQYENWSDEFCREEVRASTEKFLKLLKENIDFEHLTRVEARELRFMIWSDEKSDLLLIPLYLLPIIPIGTELTSIFGEKVIYDGHNVDKDIRFGCVAWGIEIKE